MATILDFGNLSLEDAISQKALQEDMLNSISQHLEEADAFTKRGARNLDLNKSRAIMESASKNFPLPHGMEGKTVAEVSKSANLLRSSNMMLDAIIAAKTPIEQAQAMELAPKIPIDPAVIKPPAAPSIGMSAMKLLGSAANFLQLATYPTDLNDGEDAELAKRRQHPPTLR